jgi:hypothetical protein
MKLPPVVLVLLKCEYVDPCPQDSAISLITTQPHHKWNSSRQRNWISAAQNNRNHEKNSN